MEIVKLNHENVKYVIPLVLTLWPDCVYEEELAQYENLIDSASDICYLVIENGNHIAFIHVSIRNEFVEGADKLPIAYIEGIFVTSEYHKQGIAKRLLMEAQKWAKQKGLSQIASDAECTNITSIEFHKKMGFREENCIVCFVKDI